MKLDLGTTRQRMFLLVTPLADMVLPLLVIIMIDMIGEALLPKDMSLFLLSLGRELRLADLQLVGLVKTSIVHPLGTMLRLLIIVLDLPLHLLRVLAMPNILPALGAPSLPDFAVDRKVPLLDQTLIPDMILLAIRPMALARLTTVLLVVMLATVILEQLLYLLELAPSLATILPLVLVTVILVTGADETRSSATSFELLVDLSVIMVAWTVGSPSH